jgi:hypothetical protein
MVAIQSVRCPTCGSIAQRHNNSQTIRTECLACDYVLVMCALTGKVMETYAPTLSMEQFQSLIQPKNMPLPLVNQPTGVGSAKSAVRQQPKKLVIAALSG